MHKFPTNEDFADYIEEGLEEAVVVGKKAVAEVQSRASMMGNTGGNMVLAIFQAVEREFDNGLRVAFERYKKEAQRGLLEAGDMWKILCERLQAFLKNMQQATGHEKLRSNPNYASIVPLMDEWLESFNRKLKRKLRHLEVGFQLNESDAMGDVLIVHGDSNNIVRGDNNISQQGVRESQITVNSEDIADRLALIEKELAKSELADVEMAEIRGSLDTIRAQLSRPAPSSSIVKDAVQSLQRVIENSAGNLLAHPLGRANQALAAIFG